MVNITEGLKSGRLKELSIEDALTYAPKAIALNSLLKKGKVSAFWDNELNKVAWGIKAKHD